MKKHWYLFYGTLFLVSLSASFSLSHYSFHDEKRLLQALPVIIGSVLFSFFIYKYQITGISYKIKWWISCFISILICSSLLSPLPQWAFLEVGWYVILFQLLLINAYLYQSNKDKYISILITGVILLCALYSIRVYGDYLTGLFRENWTIWPKQNQFNLVINGDLINPSGFLGFSHVRFFNHIQTWTLPILIFSYLYLYKKLIPGLRYLLLFFMSSWWMLVFAADARGTMLASLISLFCVILLYRKDSKNFSKIYGSTLITGLLFYVSLFIGLGTGGKEILTRFGDTGRLNVWLFGWEKITENLFFGLGPMHFSYAGINAPWSTPHNLIIQSAAEWGIPATVIAVGLLLLGIFKFTVQSQVGRSKGDSHSINLRISLIAAIIAVLIHSMFSGILNTPLSQLLFTIIGGLILGEYFLKSGKPLFELRQTKSVYIYLLIIICSVNVVFVSSKVCYDIPRIGERKSIFSQTYQTNKLYPRFWNQGIIGVEEVKNTQVNNGINKQ